MTRSSLYVILYINNCLFVIKKIDFSNSNLSTNTITVENNTNVMNIKNYINLFQNTMIYCKISSTLNNINKLFYISNQK